MIGPTSDDVVIPDVAEAIVGYRAWRVNFDGDEKGHEPDVLTSINSSIFGMNKREFWKPGVNESVCRANGLYKTEDGIPDHDTFHPLCKCGFYTFKSLEEVVGQYPYANVYGEVWLWGQVIEGTKGYRAEKAEVKRLFSRYRGKSEWEELRKEQYDCECGCGHEHKADTWLGHYVNAEWLGRIAEKYGVKVVEPVVDEGWEPEKPEPLSYGQMVQNLQTNYYMQAIQQQVYTPSMFQRWLTNNPTTSTSTAARDLLDTDTLLRRAGLIPASGNDPAKNNGGGMGVLWTPGSSTTLEKEVKLHAKILSGWTLTGPYGARKSKGWTMTNVSS